MKKEIMKKLLSIILIMNTIIFIISFCIAFVLLFRPFYYLHIKPLELERKSGYSYKEIKESYDDVIDYMIYKNHFSVGKMKYSKLGESHFKDCKKLFRLDFILLGITFIGLLFQRKYFKDYKIKKRSISYWSSIILMGGLILLLVIAIIFGFENLFDGFHKIFFYGKDNWLFDSSKDEVIKILPIEYFRNCGLFIVSMILIISFYILKKEKKCYN